MDPNEVDQRTFRIRGADSIQNSSLRFRRQFDRDRCLMSLEGELKHGNSESLSHEVLKLYESGVKSLIIDWRHLAYCDTAGLQSLVQIYKHVQTNPELSFQLYIEEGSLMETLRTCRFDKFIDISQDESDLEGDWSPG